MLTVIIKPDTRNYHRFTVCFELETNSVFLLYWYKMLAIVHTTLIGILLGLYISKVYFNIKIYSGILEL